MNVTYEATLLCNDCDLIFEAVDEAGQRYISVHTGDYETGCEYIIAPASPEGLAAFKNGEIDLRRLLRDSPTQQWYTAALDVNDTNADIALCQQDTPISHCDSLPGAGLYIGVGESQEIIQESVPPAAAYNSVVPRLTEKRFPVNPISTEAIRERNAKRSKPWC